MALILRIKNVELQAGIYKQFKLIFYVKKKVI